MLNLSISERTERSTIFVDEAFELQFNAVTAWTTKLFPAVISAPDLTLTSFIISKSV